LKIHHFFADFINLIYPDYCVVCDDLLRKHEKSLCTNCLLDLPRTEFHDDRENFVEQLFWGKVKLELATSYLNFVKGGKVQQIMHKFKYKGYKEVGENLGKRFGAELKKTEFAAIDAIVPVPLHKKKLKKRGYNQSEYLARGLAQSLQKPVISNVLIRNKFTETQTKKSKFDRWQNVSDIFIVNDNNQFEGKHILIVDDVVTTGSTLEVAAAEILKCNNTRVSIATLAVAIL
jgi:ComF family protein